MKVKRAIMALAIMVLILAIIAAASTTLAKKTPKTVVVKETAINLYQRPSNDSEVAKKATYNKELKVIGQKGKFFKVKSGRNTLYIKKDQVSGSKKSLKGDVLLKIKAKKAYIRSMNKKKILKTLKRGTTLYADQKGKQYKVTLSDGTKGIVSKKSVNVKVESIKASKIVKTAKSYLGAPYRSGGTSKSGIDCSGLTYVSYKSQGITLNRSSAPQSRQGKKISKKNMRAGDLLFFSPGTNKVGVSHAALYIGSGKFIHATVPGRTVSINKLSESYYKNRLVAIRRAY